MVVADDPGVDDVPAVDDDPAVDDPTAGTDSEEAERTMEESTWSVLFLRPCSSFDDSLGMMPLTTWMR